MRDSIPSPMRAKFSATFEAQMSEVKQRYLEVMRQASLRSVLRLDEGDFVPPDQPYRLPGRTEHYDKFLRRRCQISRKYFLSHKLIRTIVNKATTRLPRLLCDFGKFRAKGYLEFMEWVVIVMGEPEIWVKYSATFLINFSIFYSLYIVQWFDVSKFPRNICSARWNLKLCSLFNNEKLAFTHILHWNHLRILTNFCLIGSAAF